MVVFTLLFFLLGAIVILDVLTLQSRSAPYGDMLRQLIVWASANDLAFDSSGGSLLQLYAGQSVGSIVNGFRLILEATELTGMGRSASILKATKQ